MSTNTEDNISVKEYSDKDLQGLRTANTVSTIPPEIFERLYYQPKPNNDNSLRHKLGVPTGLATLMYTVNFFYLALTMLGWAGAGESGAAVVGIYPAVGFAGMVASIFELILGNSFAFTLMMSYGVYFMSFSTTIIPWFGAKAAYSATGDAIEGGQSEGYMATCGMFFILWSMVTLVLAIAAGMVNVVLCLYLFLVFLVFLIVAIGFFYGARGDATTLAHLTTTAGAIAFVASFLGLYMSVMNIMISVGVSPKVFPVGDLTAYWAKRRGAHSDVENTM
ncbi:hypothetical protein CANCADRAFT_3145 [Tortispora caseinolytica NRRL Y-17796]|uniref:GPR1/FUN34/YaaH-class plasma membrane protein n=1 Tax=Tortispora caseinolytica NRRL Y-17796 TaxID=767744 RepID=A0A1E4T9T4_9ASCO|nr:hypothetical protein CANCADRAFT_3145 [Tortispora caseinolytica NRRL Y-17796]